MEVEYFCREHGIGNGEDMNVIFDPGLWTPSIEHHSFHIRLIEGCLRYCLVPRVIEPRIELPPRNMSRTGDGAEVPREWLCM